MKLKSLNFVSLYGNQQFHIDAQLKHFKIREINQGQICYLDMEDKLTALSSTWTQIYFARIVITMKTTKLLLWQALKYSTIYDNQKRPHANEQTFELVLITNLTPFFIFYFFFYYRSIIIVLLMRPAFHLKFKRVNTIDYLSYHWWLYSFYQDISFRYLII